MEEAAPHQPGLAPEVRRFIERVGSGEKVTADGTWFAGDGAEAEAARPYNITDLLNMRQLVRKTAGAYEPGDFNARALRKLLDSVDDTIEQLVEASGDEAAILTHRKLREDYRNKQRALDNPVIEAAREGRLRDVDKAVIDPQSGPESIRVLKEVLGTQWWDDFGHNSLARLITDFTGPDGTVDHKGATDRLLSIGSDARNDIYGTRGEALMETLSDMAKAERQRDEATQALLHADKTYAANLIEIERERDRQIRDLETNRDERLRQLKMADANGQVKARPTLALTGIGGWLLLLIVRLWIGAAIRLIGGLAVGLSLLGLFSFASAALAGVAAYLLGRKNAKGVMVAKVFLAADASYYLLELIVSMLGGASNDSGPLPPWFKPSGYLVACVLWFAYLVRSERVKNTHLSGSGESNHTDSQTPHQVGTLLAKAEFEAIKSVLEARLTDRLREMVSHPSDKYADYVSLLKEHGDTDSIETIRRHQVSAVMSLCDHAYSMHLSAAPLKIPEAPDPNGSFLKELQNWAVAASGMGMVRALDIRAALDVYKPFERMIEDQDYLMAIVKKNAGDHGTGIGKMDMAEYAHFWQTG